VDTAKLRRSSTDVPVVDTDGRLPVVLLPLLLMVLLASVIPLMLLVGVLRAKEVPLEGVVLSGDAFTVPREVIVLLEELLTESIVMDESGLPYGARSSGSVNDKALAVERDHFSAMGSETGGREGKGVVVGKGGGSSASVSAPWPPKRKNPLRFERAFLLELASVSLPVS
jgi:hypothetical protein